MATIFRKFLLFALLLLPLSVAGQAFACPQGNPPPTPPQLTKEELQTNLNALVEAGVLSSTQSAQVALHLQNNRPPEKPPQGSTPPPPPAPDKGHPPCSPLQALIDSHVISQDQAKQIEAKLFPHRPPCPPQDKPCAPSAGE